MGRTNMEEANRSRFLELSLKKNSRVLKKNTKPGCALQNVSLSNYAADDETNCFRQ